MSLSKHLRPTSAGSSPNRISKLACSPPGILEKVFSIPPPEEEAGISLSADCFSILPSASTGHAGRHVNFVVCLSSAPYVRGPDRDSIFEVERGGLGRRWGSRRRQCARLGITTSGTSQNGSSVFAPLTHPRRVTEGRLTG